MQFILMCGMKHSVLLSIFCDHRYLQSLTQTAKTGTHLYFNNNKGTIYSTNFGFNSIVRADDT